MPKGVYERKNKEPDMSPPDKFEPSKANEAARAAMAAEPVVKTETAEKPSAAAVAEKLFPVALTKNYAPVGHYEIVGYLRAKVEVKNALGKMELIEPEKFIEGEMHPAPYPGTGYPGKIWAGTTIRLPIEEAKKVVAGKIADRADVLAA